MDEDNLLPFALPAICRKKVTIAFDGGRLSSDGGVLLLRGVEQHLGVAARLAGCLRDRRDPDRIDHEIAEMLRLRMFLIAAGYEDADDCDALRTDPVFKMAVGRLPESQNRSSRCIRRASSGGQQFARPARVGVRGEFWFSIAHLDPKRG